MAPKNESLTPADKKRNEELFKSIDSIISQMELSLYGTTKKNDHEALVHQFNDILKGQMDGLNHAKGNDVTSFMAKLFDQDKRLSWNNADLDTFLNSDDGQIMTFLSDAYQNKMLKYSDLQEIASQLIELKEAINIMRDSIVSPNLTDGGISRKFIFEFETDKSEDTIVSHLEYIEKKFDLQKKVKNHIVVKELTFGQYYAYVYPYSKIFSDFVKKVQDPINGQSFISDARQYMESVSLMDTFTMESVENNLSKERQSERENEYFTETATDFLDQFTEKEIIAMGKANGITNPTKQVLVEKVKDEIKTYMENITVCNNDVPLPFVIESPEAMDEYLRIYGKDLVNNTEKDLFTEVSGVDKSLSGVGTAVYGTPELKKNMKKIERDFQNVSDCFIKLCDPMHLIPLKILDRPIGYFYIHESDIRPVNGIMTSTVYYNKYDNTGRQRTIIDSLVNRIVMSFDKKFLIQNSELKEIIAEALTYYDLSSKKLKFQFIPVEYVCEFKVNENEKGEGVSMIEPSLFYAKLYLMLLLFKIASIILYSNDQKVNYIRTSGIDKNISNKIQEIARDKQNHQVNIMDLMSYTTMLRKIGNGTEMYIPTGRSGERGYETEILQGQDVQLNTELMELLRNCYILGTGVPSAIMNFLNEADFAKSIETANSRFQGRVMSYQIDMNPDITNFYRLVAVQSGTLTQDQANSFEVQLTPPTFANNMIKQESLTSFESIKTFVLNLFLGEQWQSDQNQLETAKLITVKLAKKYLPTIDLDEIDKWIEEIKLEALKDKLDPVNKNTDNIDEFMDDSL